MYKTKASNCNKVIDRERDGKNVLWYTESSKGKKKCVSYEEKKKRGELMHWSTK
jgi:hypothetical protein